MESVFRGAAIYIFVLLIVRLSGRRTLAQMTPFDLVLILIVAETTQQALLGDDFSLINSVMLILTLFTLDIALSYVKRSSHTVDKWLDGTPTLLVVNGKPVEEALRRSRVGLNDVMESARMLHGLERLDQIKYAVLETAGDISIIPTPEAR
jgi:uncharacterized membrane protein YcaP (DUF421 family)